ncbi:flagellar biosynthetic protein FliO [Clostridium sp. 19966]|uniref:flagellar biosynthetic protein FliO n=1 Tax=Clostridium sp. 19966 TaxID=2768166 RepID=UPI0028DD7EDE|nr:flagellar biosynthetic protein FliO [Clostridium sp. 19966]MDT8716646.1 flagellar biosynthetic protein FliO [Clostridium sp. 19966]
MDINLWTMILEILFFLPFIIFLIHTVLKYGGNKLVKFQNGKAISILERTALSKDNILLIVKVGDKGYLISSAAGEIKILKEMEEDELQKLEVKQNIDQFSSINEFIAKIKKKRKDKQ